MAKRRCRPGCMARIIYSKDVSLIGEIVLVEEWLPKFDRWGVVLMSGACSGVSLESGKFLVTAHIAFRDSSLEPLGEESQIDDKRASEVSHG